jgi:hypothetical protein
MAKIDLDTLSIEELATLRDHATEKLAEKVAARQAELEAELEKLAQYRGTKKALPLAVKLKKDEPVRVESAKPEHGKPEHAKTDHARSETVKHEPVRHGEPAAKGAREAA